MRHCAKLPEPPSLTGYRIARPNTTWVQMRDDPHHGGQQAYLEVKSTLVRGQRCLCAYCETRIAHGTTDRELEASRPAQRVEHFHPKSDLTQPPNWALHWPNLWAVCHGGSNPDREQQVHVIHPLPANLSCDAHKEHQMTGGKLPIDPQGWILAPDETPAFPILFKYAPDGTPEPHPENCAATPLPHNQYADTVTLVAKTIEHLNLGCPRLNRLRRSARAQLEKQIKQARERSRGHSPSEVMLILARRLFSSEAGSPWPEYFSLIRCRLGPVAEQRLQEVHFAG